MEPPGERPRSAKGRALLIRVLLLLGAVLVGVSLVATHGVRGVAVLVVLLLLMSARRSRPWIMVERALVQLTGSRKRAAILAMTVVIVVVLAVDVHSLLRG
jgi:hypothetical protein